MRAIYRNDTLREIASNNEKPTFQWPTRPSFLSEPLRTGSEPRLLSVGEGLAALPVADADPDAEGDFDVAVAVDEAVPEAPVARISTGCQPLNGILT